MSHPPGEEVVPLSNAGFCRVFVCKSPPPAKRGEVTCMSNPAKTDARQLHGLDDRCVRRFTVQGLNRHVGSLYLVTEFS